MCGLAGLARVGGGVVDGAMDATLRRMASIVGHRGPDDSELLSGGEVGLAFTRLSLVDPQTGGQPLVTEDGSLVLIANGEVYNNQELAAELPAGTRFRTGSDCEVLLHLYRESGVNFLDRVRGMFAVVLWDRTRQELIFARDRFGIKPLYVHRNRDRLVFASEIKALFADPDTPRRVDWESALSSSYISSALYFTGAEPVTGFTDVELVPAACVEVVDLRTGQSRRHRYWRFPEADAESGVDGVELTRRYGELLTESVVECATADAELGLFLSGGIDSSAVAALAAANDRPVHTFTVLSAGTYLNGDAEHGHLISEHLGLPNHQVLFDADRVPSPAEWKRLVWLVESAMCSPEVYYKHELHRYAKRARPELRGMLLGAASDEFNGGYSPDLSGGTGWDAAMVALRQMTLRGALRQRPDLLPWWEDSPLPLLSDRAVERLAETARVDPYQAYLAHEYRKIQQYNCWHEDRTAAGSGIEARVPFLDHRLVELVATVPRALRPDLLWNKQILRRAMRDVLPGRFVERPKVPFFYGDGTRQIYRTFVRMLAADGAALLDEALNSPTGRELLDADRVRTALGRLMADPTDGHLELLLRVVNLGLLESMTADLPAPLVDSPVPVAPPRAVEVTSWQADRPQIERLVLARPVFGCGDVLDFGPEVHLLSDGRSEGTWYLAVNGSMEYVIDEAEDGDWLRFLRAVDGIRSVGEALALAGCDLDSVRALIEMSLDERILVGSTPDDSHVPAMAAAASTG